MSEGCQDLMREDKYLKGELDWVFSGTRDVDVNVREASVVALGHFSSENYRNRRNYYTVP